MITLYCYISEYVCAMTAKLFAGWSDTPPWSGDVIRAPPTNYLQKYGFFAACIMRTAIEKSGGLNVLGSICFRIQNNPYDPMQLFCFCKSVWTSRWRNINQNCKNCGILNIKSGNNSGWTKSSVYTKAVVKFYHHNRRTNPVRRSSK
jgi:hypothetical protein